MSAATTPLAVVGMLGVLLLPNERASAQVMRPTYQVRFIGPEEGGLRVDYQVGRDARFSGKPLVTPARLEFGQPGIYRLKLTHIPGHEGSTLYPTLEIAPMTPRSAVFLAHSAIAVEFTDRDLAEAAGGKFVTRVIYLPDAEESGLGGSQRGAVLAIVRLGNKQLEEP